MPNKKSKNDKTAYCWAMARIVLGFTFLWAFLDKLMGLGFSTCRDPKTDVVTTFCDKAWINGGSPTSGFLEFATKGPLGEFYKALSGNMLVDVLFMAGLGLIGLALILGVGIRIATTTGIILMLMMYSSMLPPENNPVVDEHIVYSIVLLGILFANKNQVWGLHKHWAKLRIVRKLPIFE